MMKLRAQRHVGVGDIKATIGMIRYKTTSGSSKSEVEIKRNESKSCLNLEHKLEQGKQIYYHRMFSEFVIFIFRFKLAVIV